MIREHAFNTAWWRAPAGIVADAAFFALDARDRDAMLQPYAWVEYRAPLAEAPPAATLFRAGFIMVDTQIQFRLNLAKVAPSPEAAALTINSAAEQPFGVTPGEMAPFTHERFHALPGANADVIAARYALWANNLIASDPSWCMQMCDGPAVQGWFLAQPAARGLHLALAMLHRDAHVTGLHLYQRALAAYAQRGARIGWASFSAGNSEALNIYARLGAVFTAPLGCWLWIHPEVGDHAASSIGR